MSRPQIYWPPEHYGKPGETIVGYRRLSITGSDASKKALAQIDALLDGIVKDAVK